MLKKLQKIWDYFWKKRSELKSMSKKDVLLAKVVMDIHRLRSHTENTFVPLFSLLQVHPVNRDSASKVAEERVNKLMTFKSDLIRQRNLSVDVLIKYIPSVSAIKVVRNEIGQYLAFEGNGRIYALQRVFRPEDEIRVEVEEYLFNKPKKILRRMNRVRHSHGFSVVGESRINLN